MDKESTSAKWTKSDAVRSKKTQAKKKSDVSVHDDKNLEKKSIKISMTTQMMDMMIRNAIRNIKEGASSDDIIRYIEENYDVNTNSCKAYLKKYLRRGIENETLETVIEPEKYKLKASKTKSQDQNINENAAPLPSTSKMSETPKRKVTIDTNSAEYLESVPGPSKKNASKTPASKINVGNIESVKETKNTKSKAGKEKSMAKNEKESVSTTENKNPEKTAAHPPTSEMVVNSIKLLKKRNGAQFEDIQKYMEENYDVSAKALKSHVTKLLKKGVDNGVLEKLVGDDSKERYKIKKKTEKVKKDSKVANRKLGKAKSVKKASTQKKKAKKAKK